MALCVRRKARFGVARLPDASLWSCGALLLPRRADKENYPPVEPCRQAEMENLPKIFLRLTFFYRLSLVSIPVVLI